MRPRPPIEARDRGSTLPLILGLFLVALLVVAGGVSAGDAFVAQRQLQDECDGAAVAGASAADLDGGRHQGGSTGSFLVLGPVQAAVDSYRERDPARIDVSMVAILAADDITVTVRCRAIRSVAFGSLFGFGSGVEHNASSTSRGRLRP